MFTAIKYYTKAIPFLFKHGLAKFLLFPFIITLLVIWGGASATTFATDWLTAMMHQWLDGYSWLPEWAAWIQEVIYWLVWIVFKIVLYFTLSFVGGSVILLLMSPVLTFLSEKVAEALGAKVVAFDLLQFLNDLWRAAALAIRNGAIQLLLSIACFLIGFIPVVGVAAPFLLFAVNAYYFGFNFIDYTLERHRFNAKQSNQFVWKKKLQAVGFGTPFTLWLLVPFIGSITSGFMAVIATVATTLYLEEKKVAEMVNNRIEPNITPQ